MLKADFVLQTEGRVMVCGDCFWQLFDETGRALAAGAGGAGEVVMDPALGLFYHANTHGSIEAKSLADGRPVFIAQTLFGPRFSRSLISRRGRLMIIAGQGTAARARTPPELSLIETQDLGDSPADDLGFLTSARLAASLTRSSSKFTAALQGETIAFAVPGELSFAGPDLQVRRSIEFEGDPLSLSLDAAGRALLLTLTEGQSTLWLMSEDGTRFPSRPLPPGMGMTRSPPIVGGDGQIYVAAANRLAAFDPEGGLRWSRSLVGQLAGTVVTAEHHHLLLTAGTDLSVFDAEGHRRILFGTKGERWRTAPVLTARGEVLIAGERHLYCLISV